MITGIVLENFKCFRRVEINPKRVTCFVGANGTGKSGVLQVFGLLKQSIEKGNGLQPPAYVDINNDLALQGPLVNLTRTESMFANFGSGGGLLTIAGGYRGPNRVDHAFSYAALMLEGEYRPSHITDENSLRKEFSQMRMVPPVRGLGHPVYPLGSELAKDVSLKEGLAQQEEQMATNLVYSQAIIERISPIIQRVTGVGLRAVTVPPQSVEVNSVTPSGPVNIVSEGFGTNSLIMLLMQLTSAEQGATVMIEEPEIHLHPKAQAELAEVITEVALEEDKQVIMTTHSEHITGRLLTLVAEGRLTPDDVAIYAFEKDEEGVCTAKDLRITPDGTIEGGINDFFETNLAEMNRFAQAQFSRLRTKE